jgi:hypothetical protein
MIIKKYKEDLAARRKNEISLLRTAARLAKANHPIPTAQNEPVVTLSELIT